MDRADIEAMAHIHDHNEDRQLVFYGEPAHGTSSYVGPDSYKLTMHEYLGEAAPYIVQLREDHMDAQRLMLAYGLKDKNAERPSWFKQVRRQYV